MGMRLWVVLCGTWFLFWFALYVLDQMQPEPASGDYLILLVAALPWLVGWVLARAGRFVVRGS